MLIAFDVGNTNVTIGVFDGDAIRATWRLATDNERLADEYAVMMLGLLRAEDIAVESITEGVMASVVPDLAECPAIRRSRLASSTRRRQLRRGAEAALPPQIRDIRRTR